MDISYHLLPQLSQDQQKRITKCIAQHHQHMSDEWNTQKSTPYDFINIVHDIRYAQSYQQIIDTLKSIHARYIVLVGIGGSAMGTLAVYHALKHHRIEHAPELICFDTIDPVLTNQLLEQLQHIFQTQSYVVCIVSKSGTTVETNVNAALVIDLLQKYDPKAYRQKVVVISDDGSPLMKWAHDTTTYFAAIPKYIGGRFSIFSAAGIIPLALLGFDVHQLILGAQTANLHTFTMTASSHHNHTLHIAYYLAQAYESNMYIHNWFIFATRYQHMGLWYRQLLAESIGKQSPHGPVGITPTVTLGPIDLHSIAQLYLEGPINTTTNFLSVVCDYKQSMVIPPSPFTQQLHNNITLSDVHKALYHGIIQAYQQQERPYMVTTLNCAEHDIGYFMQIHMLSIVYLGILLEVNVFDQPGVALYKQAAHRYLTATTSSASH